MKPVAWMTAEQAATHLGYVHAKDVIKDGELVHRVGEPNMAAFYVWKCRRKPRAHRLGSRLRFRQVDLDTCVEPEPEPVAAMPRLVASAGRLRGARR